MKSKNDFGIDSPKNPLPFSTVLQNSRSNGLFDSRSSQLNINYIKSSVLPENLTKNSMKDPDNDRKELEYLKQESAYEQNRLVMELKELKEKNLDLEKKHMMLMNDLDKQSLFLNEKVHEIDYWKNKYLVLESSFSKQSTEQDKLNRLNVDLNEIINKWKEKYAEFEKTYLEQQNQFEALKIKYKRLEKKKEQISREANETKEILTKNEVFHNQLQAENEKLRRNFQEIENQQQKYIEEIESLNSEFNEYKANHDMALEEARDEGTKMIQDMHLGYQEVLHKKMQTENHSKVMMEQISELMSKTQKQEVLITDKENKLIELGVKLNEAENQVSLLNYQLSQKDQNLFKMKSEFTGVVNNGNIFGSKFPNETTPGVRLLEARVEKQQSEIISLKKSLEYNEKYKMNEKFIETIKNKEKECEELREKIRVLEIKKLDKKSDLMIEDLKFKIVLISSENERLHAVIKQIKSETTDAEDFLRDSSKAQLKIKDEGLYNFWNNNNNINENETVPRLSTRTKPMNKSNHDFIYSPTGRDGRDPVDFYSPTYRTMPLQKEKNSMLIQDYQESTRQIQQLKNQLQDSLRKKETYFTQLKYPKKNY